MSGEYAALKQVEIKTEEDLEDFTVEIEILYDCQHKNVVGLHEAYFHNDMLWVRIFFLLVCIYEKLIYKKHVEVFFYVFTIFNSVILREKSEVILWRPYKSVPLGWILLILIQTQWTSNGKKAFLAFLIIYGLKYI